jgi:hypothetical protein
MTCLKLSVLKSLLRLRLKFKQLKTRLEGLKKHLRMLKKKGKEHLRQRQLLRTKLVLLKQRLKSLRRKPKKLLLILRKPKRRQLTGRTWQRQPRKRQPKIWLMQRQLKSNERKNLMPLEKLHRRNIMLHLRSKLKHSRKPNLPLKRHIKLLRLKERLRKLNKLLHIKRQWLIEEPNSRRNSEMFGLRVTRVFHTCK